MLELSALSNAVINQLAIGEGYRQKGREHWYRCHGEKSASAHYDDAKMTFKCFGCGAGGGVTDLAKKLGIDLGAFDDDKQPTGFEYFYKNENSVPIIRKTRKYELNPEYGKPDKPKEPKWKKTFLIESWVDGAWIYGEHHHLLYNLPDVIAAVNEGRTIWIANGEKAADALKERYGLVATCGMHGENWSDWQKYSKEYLGALKGARKVVIVQDIDKHGKEFAKELSHALHQFAVAVHVVSSGTGKPGHDAFDHIRAGHVLGDFKVAYTLTRGLQGIVFFNGDFKPVDIEYLWRPYLPKGKCVLCDADGGTGKSAWNIGLAAAVSKGHVPMWRVGDEVGEPIKTLYLIGDPDGADEYETVYRANGGEAGMIGWLKHVFPFDADGLKRLEETIITGGFGLVVIDALYYYLEGVVKDANTALDVVGVCRKLGEIAARTGCTIIAIRHTTKGNVGKKASELGMGSVAFRNTFRGQLVMRWHPEEAGVVVVSDTKGSLLVERGAPFAFRRIGQYGAIEYINNFVSPFEDEGRVKPGRPSERRQDAEAELREYLTDAEVHYEVVIAHVRKATGASKNTIRRAAEAIGVVSNNGLWSLDPFAEAKGEEVQGTLETE